MSSQSWPLSPVASDKRLSVLDVPGPTPTAESLQFWEAARQGVLTIPRCSTCERFFFYPRYLCPHCWSQEWAWQPASGRATLKTYTVVHRPAHPNWSAVAPYAVGLVQLDEGPILLTHLLTSADRCQVGAGMTARFVSFGDWVLPCFAPSTKVHDQGEST